MKNDEILSAFENLKAEGRKAEKEHMLNLLMDDKTFTKALVYSLDPFKRFGMAKVSIPKTSGNCQIVDSEDFWNLLDRMASNNLTGNAATDAVNDMMKGLDVSGQEILKRILQKKPDIGGTANTVNRVRPSTIFTFECMLAQSYDKARYDKNKSWPVSVEAKLDGVRVLAFIDDDISFFSRSGKEYTSFNHLKEPLLKACAEMQVDGGMVIDGEMVSGTFNKTVSEVRKKDVEASDAVFHIFDLLPLQLFKDETFKYDVLYSERRLQAEYFANLVDNEGQVQVVEKHLAKNDDEVMAIYNDFRSRDIEGVIVKTFNGKYTRWSLSLKRFLKK